MLAYSLFVTKAYSIQSFRLERPARRATRASVATSDELHYVLDAVSRYALSLSAARCRAQSSADSPPHERGRAAASWRRGRAAGVRRKGGGGAHAHNYKMRRVASRVLQLSTLSLASRHTLPPHRLHLTHRFDRPHLRHASCWASGAALAPCRSTLVVLVLQPLEPPLYELER